ncbi:MAG: nitrile hydratase subunit beta [Alphaproteobacteria bacterium]|nr:nitrile hydratase subunit beta [Alphaproteobacteria bacterium]
MATKGRRATRAKPARRKPALRAKRVVGAPRVGRTAAPIPSDIAVAFRPGDRVRVRAIYPPGHIRTPHYIRGKSGLIERLCGSFGNPEELAFGRSGAPRQPLYRVRFIQSEVWPDYAGQRHDTVDIEIYQHWLERA